MGSCSLLCCYGNLHWDESLLNWLKHSCSSMHAPCLLTKVLQLIHSVGQEGIFEWKSCWIQEFTFFSWKIATVSAAQDGTWQMMLFLHPCCSLFISGLMECGSNQIPVIVAFIKSHCSSEDPRAIPFQFREKQSVWCWLQHTHKQKCLHISKPCNWGSLHGVMHLMSN